MLVSPSPSFSFCLSVSLMEHLPTHTLPHSCPLRTHLSIHTCLSAYVCVLCECEVFIGKANTVARVSAPVRPHCSPPVWVCVWLCMSVCVFEEHPARRSRQMRRKIILQQHLLRCASSWDCRCAILCVCVFMCVHVRWGLLSHSVWMGNGRRLIISRLQAIVVCNVL